jgi:peptide subunit release factor 1 (eRF1)
MALFAAAPAGLFEAVPLSRPVDTEVTLDVAPRLGPLLDERPEASWLVVLINSREARLLGGWIEHLVELDQWHEDVHGRQATGGWSQARYERSEEGEAAAHVRKSLARLAKLPWHTRYQHVLVATTPELREHVERDLDSTVRERLAGVVERDLLGEPPDAVLSELRPEMEKREREDEEELLARMRDGIATRGRAVGGLDDVLFALAEQRVETLLIAPGLKRPGVRCHRDGWMASGEEPDAPTTCPLDGTPLERRADIVEDALAAAVRSSAHIVPIRWHEDALGPIGGVAALLRF